MDNFEEILKITGEVGYVEQVFHSIIYVKGLPNAKPREIVVFEGGGFGEIFTLGQDYVEALMLSSSQVPIGSRVARLDSRFQIPENHDLLGKTIDPLDMIKGIQSSGKFLDVLQPPLGMNKRSRVSDQFLTGLKLVDTVLPIGKGQRELVIGSRKSGKTDFVLHNTLSAARSGLVVVYAAIGKRKGDIIKTQQFFESNKITNRTVLVKTFSSDPAGRIFLTPYVGMTIAETFRDKGQDVLVVLDDLTAHAAYYREISLLAKRFPGRESYPGDIFYIHAQLMERAGSFVINDQGDKASITCLPVAELPSLELAGYIQTNLMSMTDGHLFFNRDIFNEGRRPAIDPFLSVTRVGRQTQSELLQDLNTQITRLLVSVESLKQFMQFGSEITEDSKKMLQRGQLLIDFFNQDMGDVTEINLCIFIIAAIVSDLWNESRPEEARKDFIEMEIAYQSNPKYQKMVGEILSNHKTFQSLLETIKSQGETILGLKEGPART